MSQATANTEIANIIAAQMGGAGKIRLFTGSQLIALKNGLRIQFPEDLDSLKGINRVEVILNAADLYDVTFSRIHRPEGGEMQMDVIDTSEGIFCDMLKSVFEDTTGVFLSLN